MRKLRAWALSLQYITEYVSLLFSLYSAESDLGLFINKDLYSGTSSPGFSFFPHSYLSIDTHPRSAERKRETFSVTAFLL